MRKESFVPAQSWNDVIDHAREYLDIYGGQMTSDELAEYRNQVPSMTAEEWERMHNGSRSGLSSLLFGTITILKNL